LQGFVQLRRGIIEHLKDGRITSDEFCAYTSMILLADHKTGIWTGCSKVLAKILHWSRRQAQAVLKSLRDKKYISGECKRGVGLYRIKINKYFKEAHGDADEVRMGMRNFAKEAHGDAQLAKKEAHGDATIQEVSLTPEEKISQEEIAKPQTVISQPPTLCGFALFWEAYPLHVGEPEARKEWLRSVQADDRWPEVLSGLEKWKSCERWQDENFIPFPARFLFEKRWLNKPPGGRSGKQPSKSQERAERIRESIRRGVGVDSQLGRALRGELREGTGRDDRGGLSDRLIEAETKFST
jgi:hypothetical protein